MSVGRAARSSEIVSDGSTAAVMLFDKIGMPPSDVSVADAVAAAALLLYCSTSLLLCCSTALLLTAC